MNNRLFTEQRLSFLNLKSLYKSLWRIYMYIKKGDHLKKKSFSFITTRFKYKVSRSKEFVRRNEYISMGYRFDIK